MKSVIDEVDTFVMVDSGSTDNTKKVATKLCEEHKTELVWLTYKRQNNPKDDGAQRNVYIKYIKEHHMNDWCLVLDADELISGDLKSSKEELVNIEEKIDCLCLKTHHMIDLSHEDATIPAHWTKNRLFKIKKTLVHPLLEHGMAQGFSNIQGAAWIELWHFAYCRRAFYFLDKNKEMRNKSKIHNKSFQKWWYYSHILGVYPKKSINPNLLPKIIKDKFFVCGSVDELAWQ